MNEYFLGIGLMVVGAVLFYFGRVRAKRISVHANSGSVAVGGNNSGAIVNTNINQPDKGHTSGHAITVIAILVELAGIAVTVWNAISLAAK